MYGYRNQTVAGVCAAPDLPPRLRIASIPERTVVARKRTLDSRITVSVFVAIERSVRRASNNSASRPLQTI